MKARPQLGTAKAGRHAFSARSSFLTIRGLRGALALALALSLDSTFPDCARVLDLHIWGCGFFYTRTGPHSEAATKGPRSCEWTSLGMPEE